MKKIISIIFIITILSFCLINKYLPKKQILNPTSLKNTNNMLSLMLEQEDGTYQEAKETSWPQEGYIFNAKMSKCEKGSKVTWNDETKQIQITANKSDKCYVYFELKKDNITILKANNENNSLTENLLGDMYRFFGEDANNYLCFGTRDKCLENSDYMYRIIGVTTKDEIELMKNTSIGTYAYNSDASVETCGLNGQNCVYGQNTLSKGLNDSYFLNNTQYDYLQNSQWLSLIRDTYWNIGITAVSNTAENLLIQEKSATTSIPLKIGMASLSDITMAYEGKNETNCDAHNCISWLPKENFLILNLARIMDHSGLTNIWVSWMWNNYTGDAISYYPISSNIINVLPVFYLKSNVNILKGTGTSNDPYILDM